MALFIFRLKVLLPAEMVNLSEFMEKFAKKVDVMSSVYDFHTCFPLLLRLVFGFIAILVAIVDAYHLEDVDLNEDKKLDT